MPERCKILCVDDEVNVLKALTRLFFDEDYQMLTVESAEEGLRLLEREEPIQVVLSDYRMPGMNGVDFLREVHERWPETIRIILSGFADTAAVVSAINEGQVYRFVPKPWNDDELRVTISKAVELYRLVRENSELNAALRISNRDLLLLAEQLEEKVAERTAELEFQNRALRHSQVILDTLPVGVLGFDRDGILVQRNRMAKRCLAWLGKIPLGSAGTDFLPSAWQALLAEAGPGEVRRKWLDSEGEQFCVRAASMEAGGDQAGTVLVFEPRSCCLHAEGKQIEQAEGNHG